MLGYLRHELEQFFGGWLQLALHSILCLRETDVKKLLPAARTNTDEDIKTLLDDVRPTSVTPACHMP